MVLPSISWLSITHAVCFVVYSALSKVSLNSMLSMENSPVFCKSPLQGSNLPYADGEIQCICSTRIGKWGDYFIYGYRNQFFDDVQASFSYSNLSSGQIGSVPCLQSADRHHGHFSMPGAPGTCCGSRCVALVACNACMALLRDFWEQSFFWFPLSS